MEAVCLVDFHKPPQSIGLGNIYSAPRHIGGYHTR
jgi:hypothetical protein